ncbi:unnamed protein product [Hyaloperonospora brassicae]|uniref:RxLR effector candidate protein n=1 Tax=Hyaloperonospora brassicae TaxID=162125 RepID=A0AAV0SVX2_HYABA|nr:unnamed protein product [Hyaloperonospora brassicae]
MMRFAFFALLVSSAVFLRGVDSVSGPSDSAAGMVETQFTATTADDRVALEKDEEILVELRGYLDALAKMWRRVIKVSTGGARAAEDAASHVRPSFEHGGKSFKATPIQRKAMRTYARKNPYKWLAVAYYIRACYCIVAGAIILYGAYYYGARPYGIGGPGRNKN